MIDRDDIRARFPDVFTDTPDSLIDACIAEAAGLIVESKWGGYYDTGLLYLSAHLIVSTNPDQANAGDAGAAGPVSQRRVGDVAVSYKTSSSASSSSSGEDYESTVYGRRYLYYRRLIQGGPLVIQPAAMS